MKKSKILFFNFALLLPLVFTSSCGIVKNDCTSLLKAVQTKEMYGQVLFREFDLQQNRVLTNSTYPIRFKESVVDLLNNYIEVQKLILDKPKCLVKPELEATLQQGIPKIENKIIKASASNIAAFLEMQGELSDGYQSLELWIKK
jgi:hypothetical protein